MTNDLSIVNADAIPPIVLLVDDDRDTLDMYSTHFERQGLWVASAISCASAMTAAAELKPDLIVTDMGAGGGEKGAAIVDAIRHDAVLNETPIIVLSGCDLDTVPGQTLQDANLVLLKPVLPHALLTRIREVLAKGHSPSRRPHVPVRCAGRGWNGSNEEPLPGSSTTITAGASMAAVCIATSDPPPPAAGG